MPEGDVVVVFYDRKHGCEVRSDQLMFTKAVQTYVLASDAGQLGPKPRLDQLYNLDVVIGDIGYKGPDCPHYCNWDRCLISSDLIFLRLEDNHNAEIRKAGSDVQKRPTKVSKSSRRHDKARK